jgi:hypothetical protein
VSSGIDVPKHFSVTQKGSDTFLLKERYKYPILRQIVMEFSAEVREGKSAFYGRGACLAIPVSDLRDRRLIIRHYSHGGLWGKLAGDILWGHNRPLNELVNTEKALKQGVDTAEVVALRFKNFFGPLCRADIFTMEIADAEDLIAFLTGHTAEEVLPQKKLLIGHIAKAVRKMHDTGIYHADLHLKNILVKLTDIPKVYIIDLDKSEFNTNGADRGLPTGQRMDNILRLDRSVEKFNRWRPDLKLIAKTDRLRFLREYTTASIANEGPDTFKNDWKDLARRYTNRYAAHRLWWGLLRTVGLSIYGFDKRPGQQ